MLIVYHVLYILLILNYNCIYAYNIYIYIIILKNIDIVRILLCNHLNVLN